MSTVSLNIHPINNLYHLIEYIIHILLNFYQQKLSERMIKMKKITSLALVVVMLFTSFLVTAKENSIKIPKKYEEFVADAIEHSEFSQDKIDTENIFVVENTSYINLKKSLNPIMFFIALPIANSNDISYAGYEDDIFVKAFTNFVSLDGIVSPYSDKLYNHIKQNELSNPTEVKNLWVSERVHLFAFDVICDGIEYIIPYHFTEFSKFNVTQDDECVIKLGRAYTIDEFVAICKKEDKLYNEHMAEEREKSDKTVITLDENGDKVIKNPKENKVYRQDHVGDINSYLLREKFTFSFVADESFEGVITEEVAETGETVYCESRVYLKEWSTNLTKNKHYTVMTLKGSKGEIDIWGGIRYDLNYIPLYKPTDVIMVGITANRVIRGYHYEPLVRYNGGDYKDDTIYIKAEFDGTKITGMKINYVKEEDASYKYGTDYMKGAKDCTSFDYELLIPLEEITEKEKEEEKALEDRNPQKYVTKVKGKMRDGSIHDYRINSIYKIPLKDNFETENGWFKKLGDDVNVYLISFTQIFDGKDRRNYTMLKFEGTKDKLWFINGNAQFGKKSNGTQYIESEYYSLISFDGYERVRNTEKYETVSLDIKFSGDEEKRITSVGVLFEDADVYADAHEMTYIGGGALTYESFF